MPAHLTVQQHAETIFQADLRKIILRTDRMFFWLLIGQWIFGIGMALFWSPRTWIAQYWSVHQHVIAATVLGALFAAYPIFLIIRKPGTKYTRHIIAIGQMLQSALLVHVTGGRIETHFHVFGSLALLAFYRDWRVLMTATAVVYLDHLALGFWFPLSAYGVPVATIWRAMEHAFWVIFEVVFLTLSCRTGIQELRAIADRESRAEEAAAQLREAHHELERRVQARTAELAKANEALTAEVAERTQAEEALAQRAGELRTAYDDLKDTQAQLIQAEKMGVIGQLASGVAHEVTNPLQIIVQSVDYLSHELHPSRNGQCAEAIQTIKEAILRADKIVRELLSLSRPSPLELKPVALSRVVDVSLSLVEKQLSVKHIQVTKNIAPDLPAILLDENQLKQVFINLILNALQAMPIGGRLSIRGYPHTLTTFDERVGRRIDDLFKPGDTVVVCEIEDTGVGIPAKALAKVFDPFYTTKPPGQGTGLGLTVTQRIVKRHGGSIRMESREGRGTKAVLTFPITRGKADA